MSGIQLHGELKGWSGAHESAAGLVPGAGWHCPGACAGTAPRALSAGCRGTGSACLVSHREQDSLYPLRWMDNWFAGFVQ